MTFAERVRSATRDLAIVTLRDPAATDDDRAAARKVLLRTPDDVTRLSDAELSVACDVADRMAGGERSTDRTIAHELAVDSQRYANERAQAWAAIPTDNGVTPLPHPRCRRCQGIEDDLLLALAEVQDEERRRPPVVLAEPGPLMLPKGRR